LSYRTSRFRGFRQELKSKFGKIILKITFAEN